MALAFDTSTVAIESEKARKSGWFPVGVSGRVPSERVAGLGRNPQGAN